MYWNICYLSDKILGHTDVCIQKQGPVLYHFIFWCWRQRRFLKHVSVNPNWCGCSPKKVLSPLFTVITSSLVLHSKMFGNHSDTDLWLFYLSFPCGFSCSINYMRFGRMLQRFTVILKTALSDFCRPMRAQAHILLLS